MVALSFFYIIRYYLMKNMKIAIVSPVFPPYAGGMANVAFHHARLLQEKGFDVVVFTPNYKRNLTEKINYQGIPTVILKPVFQFGNAALIPSLRQSLNGFDVVFLHYPFFGADEMLFGLKKRLIVFYHMDVVGQGLFRAIFLLHKKIFLPLLMKKAEKVIVSSFDYANGSDIKKYYIASPEKFVEIPCGVDSKHFFPSDDFQLPQGYDMEGKKIILFVGGLDSAHYFKGVEILLEAFSMLSQDNAIMFIVGSGNMADQYKHKAAELGVGERVVFCGRVEDDDLPKFYNKADIVVLPSIDKTEAFGIVLIEAMACAKPVVATNLAGVRSVVENGVNGILVESKNARELSLALEKILSDNELAKKMGEAGLKKIRERYEWERVGEKLEILFNKM